MSNEFYKLIDIYSYEEVWSRVISSTDIKNQTELANIVGVKQGAVSSRKKNDVWPEEWAYRIGKRYNLLTEWILTGVGPKSVADIASGPQYKFPILSDVDEWLSEIVVNEPHRRDWFKGNLEDAFPMFKEWKKRKEEQKGETDITTDKKIA